MSRTLPRECSGTVLRCVSKTVPFILGDATSSSVMTEEAGILAQRIEKSMQKELRPVHLGGNFFSAKSLHFHAATARLARTFATCGSIGLSAGRSARLRRVRRRAR